MRGFNLLDVAGLRSTGASGTMGTAAVAMGAVSAAAVLAPGSLAGTLASCDAAAAGPGSPAETAAAAAAEAAAAAGADAIPELSYTNPADLALMALEQIHIMSGLPWWMTIVGSTLALRTLMLPIMVGAMANTAKMAKMKVREADRERETQRQTETDRET